RVRVLGSAAGGGLPQWNCRCSNCLLARRRQIPPQRQSCIAITGDCLSWWLVNASPDLAAQIEQFLPLQPQANELRTTPIAGVLLTNADVDHALGVLLMRQRDSALPIYTSDEIRC